MTGISNNPQSSNLNSSFEDLGDYVVKQEPGGAGSVGTAGNNGFEILDDDSLVQATGVPQESALPDNMLKNVKFHKCNGLSQEQIRVIDNLRAPKTRGFFSNLFSKIGRSIVSFVSLFRSSSSKARANDTLRERTEMLRAPTIGYQIKPLPKDTQPVSMDYEQMGRLTGLGSKTGLVPFEPYENSDTRDATLLQKMLYPHGSPRIDDVKQDPKLQDCWFLSSIITALNTSRGTIEQLFSPSETEGNVLVRLGNKQYDVPLGRYTNGSETFGSRSANWVVALENAMQMHLMATKTENYELTSMLSNSDPVNMRMKDAAIGLQALFGNSVRVNFEKFPTDKNAIEQIKTNIDNGYPVVLGHAGGLFNALADGISPGHAVSVLGLSPDKSSMIVQDPYGKAVELPFSALSHCVVYTVENK